MKIVEEWKTNLISLAILFHFLCAQHVSDINICIIRSLRLCCWIITSVVLFSVRDIKLVFHSSTITMMHGPINISLYEKYGLLLSNIDQNWNMLTNFRRTSKYQIPRKSVQWVLSCYMQTGRYTKDCEYTNKTYCPS